MEMHLDLLRTRSLRPSSISQMLLVFRYMEQRRRRCRHPICLRLVTLLVRPFRSLNISPGILQCPLRRNIHRWLPFHPPPQIA
jgi:hypothetical protein